MQRGRGLDSRGLGVGGWVGFRGWFGGSKVNFKVNGNDG
jgi:hypothetical protein